MSGKEVKKILIDNGFQLAYVAEKMGIIPQTLQSLLNAADIKTGVLENIASAISKSVYYFYESNNTQNDLNTRQNTQKSDDLGTKNELIEELKGRLQDKEEIIALLREENTRLKKEVAQVVGNAECAAVG